MSHLRLRKRLRRKIFRVVARALAAQLLWFALPTSGYNPIAHGDWKLYPQTPVCGTLELHQYAQHTAWMKPYFEQKSLGFDSSPPTKILIACLIVP